MPPTPEKLVPGGWASRSYVQNIWLMYKLTLEGFNKLWYAQEGKCAGCLSSLAHPVQRSHELGKRPEIDHDHGTGKVRGLLCRKCNDFLGKIKDNKEQLKRLEQYLQKNGDWS